MEYNRKRRKRMNFEQNGIILIQNELLEYIVQCKPINIVTIIPFPIININNKNIESNINNYNNRIIYNVLPIVDDDIKI